MERQTSLPPPTPQPPDQPLAKSTNAVLDYLLHLNHSSCSICLLEFQFTDKLMILPCFHTYHTECATKWLFTKGACPMCLKPVRKCPPELFNTLSELVKPQFKQFNEEFTHVFQDFLAVEHNHDILQTRKRWVENYNNDDGQSLGLDSDSNQVDETACANANNDHDVDFHDVDPHLLHMDTLIKSILHQHTEQLHQEQEFSDDFDE